MCTTLISGLNSGGRPVMSHGVNTLPIKCVMKLPWEFDFHSREEGRSVCGKNSHRPAHRRARTASVVGESP